MSFNYCSYTTSNGEEQHFVISFIKELIMYNSKDKVHSSRLLEIQILMHSVSGN